MPDTSHSLLFRIAHAPSDTSWRSLAQVYEPFISYWLKRLGVPTNDQADLSQEVFTVLVKELPQFRHSGNKGAFRSWLRTIVSHRVRHYFRSAQVRTRGMVPAEILNELEAPESSISQEWDREHDAHVTRELLAALEKEFTPATWLAFKRQVVDGVKAAQVAEETGQTVNAVFLAKSRVLRRFREEAAGILDEI
ncbi:MAG: sigma-70 family RNA polymerase sigma factor [Gemmatales bacterium]